jgi:branched-chain amino acid transport system substrate-binding protein
VALVAGFSSMAGAATIKVGSLNDMTGATSDVGKDYALGIAEAIHYVNDTGGINGKQIKLYQFDYGYRIPEALTKYNLFKRLKCVAILGWGTGDTEALAPTVARDKIPYLIRDIYAIRKRHPIICFLQRTIRPSQGGS